MDRDKFWRRYFMWFVFAVALITVYKTIDSFGIIFSWFGALISLLAPFGLGILFAYILYFPARRLEKLYSKIKIEALKKRARGLSIITITLIIVLLIVFLINIIFPILKESILDLANSLPAYYIKTIEWLEDLPDDSILTKIDAISYVKKIEEINISEMIEDFITLDNIGNYINGIKSIGGYIFDVFITVVITFYALSERSDIKSFFKNFSKAVFSEKNYKRVRKYYHDTNSIFYSFITAQLFDAFVVGIITTIAMTIMKVKYAVLFGFIIGLFNIIPYFGAIVGCAIAIIITIFTGGFTQALTLAFVIILLQQIDANIINPKILGDSLKLSRLLIVFSVTFFGAYFKIIGMFLAVPMIAMIKIIVMDFIDEKNIEKEKAKKIEQKKHEKAVVKK